MKKFFLILSSVYGIGLLLFLTFPEHFLRDLLINFLPYIVILHLPLFFLVWFLSWGTDVRHSTVASRSAFILLLSMMVQGFFVLAPYRSAQETVDHDKKGSSSFKVLFANVNKYNTDYDGLFELLKKEQPMAFGIAELTPPWSKKLDLLSKDYPYSATLPMNDGFGIGFYSKAPLQFHSVDLLPGKIPFIETAIMVQKKRLKFIIVHCPPPIEKNLFDARNRALQIIQERIRKGETTIVMGDFNLTPWSFFYERFTKATGLENARSLWRGFQMSWYGMGFYLPIDHLFHSSDIAISRFEIGPEIGSDHYPLISKFTF